MFETKLTIVGTVITSPVLTHTRKAGVPVVNFRVATTSRTFNRELGRWVDGSTLFLKVACWRRLAENVVKSVHRGDPIVVTGNLFTQSYRAQDGSRRWSYEVEASSIGPDLTRGTATFVRSQSLADMPSDRAEPAEFDSGESVLAALGAAALEAAADTPHPMAGLGEVDDRPEIAQVNVETDDPHAPDLSSPQTSRELSDAA
jgi:single-strand DNA-binding protein